MIFKKPKFWDNKNLNIFSFLLLPLTVPVHINNFFFKTCNKFKSPKVFSICIGNIYLGGTGKTPTTIKLFHMLKNFNKKIVTAKKFYKNQFDEINLLNKKTKLITGRNRREIIDKVIRKGFKIVIFDDGLQDKKIDYNLKIVCFDTLNWIGNGQLIPAGPLRESLNSLKRYDVVILKNISKRNIQITKLIKKINDKIKIYNTEYIIKNKNEFNLKKNYLTFSGIGNPESFNFLLKKNKFKIIENYNFPDHYEYSNDQINKIIKRANELNAQIITTEKDFTKIPKYFHNKINFIDIDLKIDQFNNFKKFIKEKIHE